MTSARLLEKAERNLKSAALLLADGDYDATANRAYYAMYNAARAALFVLGEREAAAARTHAGLISAFSLHLVKPGHLAVELGRALASASSRRMLGDYDDRGLDEADARQTLSEADGFVAGVNEWVAGRGEAR